MSHHHLQQRVASSRGGLSTFKMRVAVVLSSAVWFMAAAAVAELPRLEHSGSKYFKAGKGDGSLAVLVVGDWGRKGAYNQTQVATQMGVTAEAVKIDFVISTGDNFYDDGLTGVDDPNFYHSFADIYTAPSLQKQWYNAKARWKIVVGHHTIKSAGHHGNTVELEAQLLPILEAHDVDLYVNGHDHCLEHISSSRTKLSFSPVGQGRKRGKVTLAHGIPRR
ncbi:unnamed protein product [Linum tenue]|uniref:Calcineurin-like phosphoesterase domain-containing protein n=1 Tax=Linum tenue TaxID=586396 RepID=A0AAV0R9G4_9ROSI|nr:unnamed protein product [Linum tenue]